MPTRIARWIRAHPKVAAGLAAVVVILAIAGITSPKGPTDNARTADGKRTLASAPSSAVLSPGAAPDSSSSAGPAPANGPASTSPTAAITAAPADNAQASSTGAAQLLATLEVKGRAPKTGYARDAFGPAWTDDSAAPLGHNGCDTRNDILRRDLVDIVYKPGSNDCAVQTGTLQDPYTGKTITFVRGADTSTAVQIDHVVALSDAWQKGAQYWPADKRVTFANDPLNLLAVDGPANMRKGDGDAATWLPPNTAYRCAYVARQVAVKARYEVWVTQAEHDAMARILAACPGQTAPSGAATAAPPNAPPPAVPPPAAPPPAAPPPAGPPPAAPPPPPAPAQPSVYQNCDAMHRDHPHGVGRPGASDQSKSATKKPVTDFLVDAALYQANSRLDADKDGIACEK